ncbi:hypothetical protein L6164_017635 [Bauhinia variegata]|uniref:Uncharacterized protein n=1 Tax=Bauhinia variegata TaxID=167791 RepID=A0ACB9N8R6_BAUVA|nr:hypothetical protein L6164_017635 [Bauhinia variegata]
MEEAAVVIVGAGPAGLATSACLNKLFIPNIVLERDDSHSSLWKKRTYDRLKLHLGKEFCNLPHTPFPRSAPTFVPRIEFLRYLDNYVSRFNIIIRCNRSVESASLESNGRWKIIAKDTSSNATEVYIASFLVVATGENSSGYIPKVTGLDAYGGEYLHCNKYLNGRKWYGKNVLVVGCGNSGMEIAYDLSNWGVNASIVVRHPVHILTKEMVYVGMHLLKFLPVKVVDIIILMMCILMYRNLSKYGLRRPKEGPFFLKGKTGHSPTIDVGCVPKIKKGEIKVFPGVSNIKDKIVEFDDGRQEQFDAIIFATGYRSTVLKWLKDYKLLFDENGMPKQRPPNHWKGESGIYCAGFSRQGLAGISQDAQRIANDIHLGIVSRIPPTLAPVKEMEEIVMAKNM